MNIENQKRQQNGEPLSEIDKFKIRLERDIENVSDVRKLADEVEERLYTAEDSFISIICDNIEEVAQLGTVIDQMTIKFQDLQATLTQYYDEIYGATTKIRELEAQTKSINTMISNREDAIKSIGDYLELIDVDQTIIESLESLPIDNPKFITNLIYFDNKHILLSTGQFSKAKSAAQCLGKLSSSKQNVDRKILNSLSELMAEKSVGDFKTKVMRDETTYKTLFSFLLRTGDSSEADKFIKTYSKKLIGLLKTEISSRVQKLSAFQDPDVYTPPIGFLGLGKDYGYNQTSAQGTGNTPPTSGYVDSLTTSAAGGKVPKQLIVPQQIMDIYEDYITTGGSKYIKPLIPPDTIYSAECVSPEKVGAPFSIECFNRKKLFEKLQLDAPWNDAIEAYVSSNNDFEGVFRQHSSRNPFKRSGGETSWMTTERAVYFILAKYINLIEAEVRFGLRMFGTDSVAKRVVEETVGLVEPFFESRTANTSDFSILLTMSLFAFAEMKCDASALGVLKPHLTRWKTQMWLKLQPFINRTVKILEMANGIPSVASAATRKSTTKNRFGSSNDSPHVPVGVTAITIQLGFLLRTLTYLEPKLQNTGKILSDRLFNTYTQYIYTVELGKEDVITRSQNNISFVAVVGESKKARDIADEITVSTVSRLCALTFPSFSKDYKMFGNEKLLNLGVEFWRDLIKNITTIKETIDRFEPTSSQFKERLRANVARRLTEMYDKYYEYLKECVGSSVVLSNDGLVVPNVLREYIDGSLGVAKGK